MSIAANIHDVRERIAAAARRAGRNPEEVALMAVTKTFPPELIRQAYEAGQRVSAKTGSRNSPANSMPCVILAARNGT